MIGGAGCHSPADLTLNTNTLCCISLGPLGVCEPSFQFGWLFALKSSWGGAAGRESSWQKQSSRVHKSSEGSWLLSVLHTWVLTHHGRPLPTSLELDDRLVGNGKHNFTIWFFCLEDRAWGEGKGFVFSPFSFHLINDLEVAAGVTVSLMWARLRFGNSHL